MGEALVVIDPGSAIERSNRDQRDKLWRALLLFSGDREVASDALAEAYAQALRRGRAIRNPDGWAWCSAFRIARGELQRRGRNSRLVDIPVEMPAPTADPARALGHCPRSNAPR